MSNYTPFPAWAKQYPLSLSASNYIPFPWGHTITPPPPLYPVSNYYPILWGLTIPILPARFKLNPFPWDQIITPFPIGQNISSYHWSNLTPPPFPLESNYAPFLPGVFTFIHPPPFYTSNYFQIQRFRNGCQMQAESNRKEGWSLGGGGGSDLSSYLQKNILNGSLFLLFVPLFLKKLIPQCYIMPRFEII